MRYLGSLNVVGEVGPSADDAFIDADLLPGLDGNKRCQPTRTLGFRRPIDLHRARRADERLHNGLSLAIGGRWLSRRASISIRHFRPAVGRGNIRLHIDSYA